MVSFICVQLPLIAGLHYAGREFSQRWFSRQPCRRRPPTADSAPPRPRIDPPRTASRQPMPSLWRTPLNTGYPSSHRHKPRKPQTTLLKALMSILLSPTGSSRKEATTSIGPTASTRAVSSLRHRGAIVNWDHLRYVVQQACLVCGRKQSDPHHLRE